MKMNTGIDNYSRCVAYSMSCPVSQIMKDASHLEKELRSIYDIPDSIKKVETSGRSRLFEHLTSLMEQLTYHTSLVGELVDSIVSKKWSRADTEDMTDLNRVITHWADRIRDEGHIDPGVRLTLKLNRNIPDLPIRESELFQIVYHVLKNAVEAIPSSRGGNVTIKTDISDKTDSSNRTVIFEVMDDGYGIQREIRQKVFDQFYSTKNHSSSGKPHPGLGLYIAEQVVRSYGGRIELHSEEGIGTVISIFLPVTENEYRSSGSQINSMNESPQETDVTRNVP
ncbi:MAG: HAMP domain-containing histidine kinase [Candidatus Krumholzibacteria bacterium]|nr:HAMP domain-containing histidine kinase [Candidatus Krumholzibacteria bacterium]